MEATFQISNVSMVPEQFRSKFRVIPVMDYLDEFASDRSHMLYAMEFTKALLDGGDSEYRALPPDYPCIVGRKALSKGISNNFMQTFVEMNLGLQSEGGAMGKVMSDIEFWEWGICL
ncbi:hypothetical protein K439DRAFT_1394672 [Ramaria rubella]|nr:hypothetical protein K439DRAFT_1394672 [Ramaria rubella]